MAHEGTPHRVLDNILDGAANGAKGLVSGLSGALTSAGEGIQTGLDAPWKSIGGPDQPLRIVDRLLDGAVQAGVNAVNQGVIETVKQGGDAIQNALDHPVENFGIPPSMGEGMRTPMSRGFGRFKLPRL